MKVCQLCAVDFTLQKFLVPLIDGMKEEGWDVTAVCSDGPSVNHLRNMGYKIHTLNIRRTLNPFSAFRAVIQLTSLFRSERFDAVHVHTPVAALLGRLAAKFAGVPFVVYTAHGFYFHGGMSLLRYQFFLTLEKVAGAWTDLLFCQSAEDADAAKRYRIIAPTRVVTIGNGVDIQRFSPACAKNRWETRSALGIPNDNFVVGFVGRLIEEKGVRELLVAITSLATRYPKLCLLLVGDRLDSDRGRTVRQSFDEAGLILGERLVATGLRDDIPDLLAAMDVFCLPSWREGMPRTIIEAMSMGVPVIATDIRGSREEVIDGETGLLIAVKSPSQLALAIEKFLQNPSMIRDFGMAGRARALNLFDEKRGISLQIASIARRCNFPSGKKRNGHEAPF